MTDATETAGVPDYWACVCGERFEAPGHAAGATGLLIALYAHVDGESHSIERARYMPCEECEMPDGFGRALEALAECAHRESQAAAVALA